MQDIKIAIASDHAGYELKKQIVDYLKKYQTPILDMGTFSSDSVDYPDFAYSVVRAIESKQATKGILICGSGIGMSIAANRSPKIRAALCTSPLMATLAREHNDANVLALGARITDLATAFACVKSFITTEFTDSRHQNRIDKLSKGA